MTEETTTQEVRAIIRLRYDADAGLDAAALRDEIVTDINRLADADSESRVAMNGGDVAIIHEERDIYGNDGTVRPDPLDLLNELATEQHNRDEANDLIALTLGSTVDKPAIAQPFYYFAARDGTVSEGRIEATSEERAEYAALKAACDEFGIDWIDEDAIRAELDGFSVIALNNAAGELALGSTEDNLLRQDTGAMIPTLDEDDVEVLRSMVANCTYSDNTTEDEDKALKRVLAFVEAAEGGA